MEVSILAGRIDALVQLLRTDPFYQLCRDTSPLESLKSKLFNIKRKTDKPLVMEVSSLKFSLQDIPSHTMPKGVTDLFLELTLKIAFSGRAICFEELNQLEASFELVGTDATGNLVKSAWHLDYHHWGEATNFVHPLYHFQFGGHQMRASPNEGSEDFASGDFLLMESPRLVQPPMDLFIALDYIFGNYFTRKHWLQLRRDRDFKAGLIESQSLLWKPFYTSMSNHFDESIQCEKASKLNPHLIS